MPYIKEEFRKKIEGNDPHFNRLEYMIDNIDSEGDLNYTITRLCHLFLKKKGEKYSVYNTIIGVLECAKLELYRRKVAHYEDIKIIDNGDVE
jgi:hypothetical protein